MTDQSYKAAIPTRELKLGNGETIVSYQYITIGESRQLQKMMLEGGKFNVETGRMENINVAKYYEIQDISAGFAIKEIKAKDGTAKPFSQDWLNSLPKEIGEQVYKEIDIVSGMSNLKPVEKKS